jgi:polysaccharide biosynthesis protein PslH
MSRVVHRLVTTSCYDAVVAFQMPVARYALAAGGIPRILDIDVSLGYQRYEALLDTMSTMQRFRHCMSWKKTHRYEQRLIKHFDACTVVAPAELEFVRQTFRKTGAQFYLNENGVDCTHNSVALAPKASKSLIYNGALTYSANYDAMRYFLADIYPLIKQQMPAVSLAITGSLSGVDLSGLALDESVHLTGYVPDVRIPVAEASVCVIPIRQGSGTRIKILEAMALGTPVVATSKGAEGLDVTPSHDILIADDSGSFASQVIRLLRNESLRYHLVRNARLLVERRYDWRRIGAQFVALVEEVAGLRKQDEGRVRAR